MKGSLERRLAELLDENRHLKQLAASKPRLLSIGATSRLLSLQIIRGNTLSDGSTLGIKWASTAPTSVPSLYDPNVDTSFIDGIGVAFLFDGTTSSKVLVAHYAGNGNPFTQAYVAGMLPVTNGATLFLPLDGDPTKGVSLVVPISP